MDVRAWEAAQKAKDREYGPALDALRKQEEDVEELAKAAMLADGAAISLDADGEGKLQLLESWNEFFNG